MTLPQALPQTVSANLLKDCIEFYPIFNRWPTYKEIVDWSDLVGGTVSLQTFKAVLRQARKALNEQLQ